VKLATVDIGTNTTLLLVAEGTRPEDVRVVLERAEITRLGRGIGKDGRLGAEGIARTLGVLAEYAALARAEGARLAAVGTEALRRAPNAGEFLGPAAALLGDPVEVIDGAREASLTFRAAATSFPDAAAGTMAVVDIGGGSTEVILAEAGAVRIRESLPLGSVRLTERHVRHDPPEDAEVAAIAAEIEAGLDRLALPARGDAQLVGTAGTVTTLAAMALQLADYDPARVHGFQLSREALEAQVERLRRSRQSEREVMVGLDPRRADVILAGACVLSAIVRRVGATAVLVSDRGIRWGLLYEILAGAPSPEAKADGR
jgi:exopolyphosphatase/guanosine-5'-triphosphate,3'-diphosphate pyrophosphatase